MKVFSTPVAPNSLHIFESVREEERHTGLALANDLLHFAHAAKFGLYHTPVSSKSNFVAEMQSIATLAATSGLRPILHFEMHGSPTTGLAIQQSGESVDWPLFATLCRAISVPTENNLVIVMSVCAGFHAVLQVDIRKATPFTFLIGSQGEVDATRIDSAFGDFYRQLWSAEDFGEAIPHLPSDFRFYNCEQLLVRAYARHAKAQTRRSRQARLERLLTISRQQSRNLPLRFARKLLRAALKPSRQSFDRLRNQFLLADVEANIDRFAVTFEDAIHATGVSD